MSTKEKLPKFIYARHISGQNFKIPLNGASNNQVGYIQQYLLNAGIPYSEFRNVSYSTSDKNVRFQINRKDFDNYLTIDASKEPPIPVISSLNEGAPFYSEMVTYSYASLSELKADGFQFTMNYSASNDSYGSRNIFDYERSDFKDPAQYDEIVNGNIGFELCLLWIHVDTFTVAEGQSIDATHIYEQGMENAAKVSVSTTLGASYAEVSIELTAALKYNITITSKSTSTYTTTYNGVPNKVLRYDTWQLCELIRVVRKNDDGTYSPLDGSYEIGINETDKHDNNIDVNYTLDSEWTNNTIKVGNDSGGSEKLISNVLIRTERTQDVPTYFDA